MIAFLLALQIVSTVGHEVPPIIGMDEQCTTVQPGADWICRNGNWLPPPDPAPVAGEIHDHPPIVSFPETLDDGDTNEGRIDLSPPCDGQQHAETVRNDWDRDVWINSLDVWNGVSMTAIVDFQSQVFLNWSDTKQKVLWNHSWDHYAPTSWHAPWSKDFTAGFRWPRRGWLTFVVKCSSVRGVVTELQGAQVHVFFVAVKP